MMVNEEYENGPPRALQNELVLENIFNFVDFKTLKDCRIVCTKWNSICDSIFKKRAKVVCSIRNVVYRYHLQASFYDFKNLFFRDGSEFRYSSLELVGNLRWKFSELQEFFLNEGRSITELEIKDLTLIDDHFPSSYIFNNEIDVTTFITPNLKRLIINNSCSRRDGSRSLLDTSALASLDYLDLKGCLITLTESFLISPKEISLKGGNVYYRNENQIQRRDNVPLTEFVNMERLEKLTIDYWNLSLDLSGIKALKSLTLSNVKTDDVKNWDISEWHINKLKLEGFEFQERTPMNINKLELRDRDLNFTALPTTIEKLIIFDYKGIAGSSDNINLPLLKCLVLETNFYINPPSCLKDCHSLTDMAVYSHPKSRGMKLNVDNLPINVNKLLLNQQFQISGIRESQLDTLVLVDYPPSAMYGRELYGLPAKHLIYLNILQPFHFDANQVRNIFKIAKDGECESVTVGPFEWDKVSKYKFAVSSLCQDVGECEFYTFQAEQVKSIGGFLVRENIKNLFLEKMKVKFFNRHRS